MAISKKETKEVAELGRLELSDKEIKKFADQISPVLDYFKDLQKLDTKNVEATNQVTGLTNIARKDRISKKWKVDKDKMKNREILLNNAPASEQEFIKVPQVFESQEH